MVRELRVTGPVRPKTWRTESAPDLTQAGRGADKKPCQMINTRRGASNRACERILANFNAPRLAVSAEMRCFAQQSHFDGEIF